MSVEATNQDIITLLLTSEFMELDCTIHLSILSFRPTVSFPEPECRKAFIAIFYNQLTFKMSLKDFKLLLLVLSLKQSNPKVSKQYKSKNYISN